MEFKFTRSDFYLMAIYFAIAIPIGFMDYEDYDKKYLIIVDVIEHFIFISITGYILVFVIFAKYLPKQQFFLLFLFTLILLFGMGALIIQSHCFWRDCNGASWSMKYIYYGFNIILEDVGIFAALLVGKKMYDAQVKYLTLEKEKKESELRFLKNQIDPHFLFNNLNTVDALIDSNPDAAKIYLNKLSKLYRYLISSKDQEVVPLEEELDFVHNYIYLINYRFGDAFRFEIINHLSNDELQLIPPGALQTLLENIVKHNQVSTTEPLVSKIIIDKNAITVSNDLKATPQVVDSTGTGLANLRARYKLLTDADIEIQKTDQFIVRLPAIKQVA